MVDKGFWFHLAGLESSFSNVAIAPALGMVGDFISRG